MARKGSKPKYADIYVATCGHLDGYVLEEERRRVPVIDKWDNLECDRCEAKGGPKLRPA